MIGALAKAVGALMLLAIAVIAGLAGWTQSLALTDPDAALELDPGQAEALRAKAERVRLADGGSTGEVVTLGARLIRREVLLDAPLVYAGLDFAAQGDDERARSAFVQALRRQPRNVPALSWLAVDALRQKDYRTAVNRLERLAELNADNRPAYADALASIASDTEGVSLLEERLRDNQLLAQLALAKLNQTSGDTSLLLRLNAYSKKDQAAFVERLVERQGVSAAFIAWLDLAPAVEVRKFDWPFDPVFLGSEAPPPFNWVIRQGAEYLEQGGLFARYPGRGNPVFAEQLTLLGPGAYRFNAQMDGEATPTGGGFEWRLTCQPSKTELGAVAIHGLDVTISEHGFNFIVPSGDGCAGQSLTLRGKPGELPDKARGVVRRVQFLPAGAP